MMSGDPIQFSASSNGDRWLLERGTTPGEDTVIHRANPPSGGMETRLDVKSFLEITGDRPEAAALRDLLGKNAGDEEAQPAPIEPTVEAGSPSTSPWAKTPGKTGP
ncbi:hypothetical protein [Rhizobium sp. SAFR-030]|uniref:hypothetical protein n=1 Tax=Rhizobium sp. SAFR-030 TaxID=3387277 RepID=UPI003F7FC1C2